MEMLRSAAAALCGTLIVTAIFSMLIPQTGDHRFLKLAVRLFFLLCIAVPLVRNRVDLELDVSRYLSRSQAVETDLQALADSQLLEAFSGNLREQVRQILRRHAVEAEKIETGVHIGPDRSIEITTIKIILEEEASGLGDALAEIQRDLGAAASVVYSRGEK